MKYTIVTGAASDIGKAICTKLADNGHQLLLLDIDGPSMEEFLATLSKSHTHRSLIVDFSDTDNFGDIIKSFINDNHIIIESAIFAAGIFSVKPLRMITHDYFQESINIALYSVIQIMQIVTSKKINADNFKSAVIISSVSARIGTKGYVLYSAVKSALLGIMHSLAVEFAPKVRINAILPGGIRTKATAFIYEVVTDLNSRSLLGEGSPFDIACLVYFLLSDESKWITGQEFVIDGGSSIN